MTYTPSTQIARDFYVSDTEYNSFELKAVPAGGYAPKKTHFVARVNADGSTIIVDKKLQKRLEEWLVVERYCELAAQAAESGRYCHGNGADFIYVEGIIDGVEDSGFLVHLNLVRGDFNRTPLSDPSAKRYIASTYPHTEMHTAESLRTHAASKMVMEEVQN